MVVVTVIFIVINFHHLIFVFYMEKGFFLPYFLPMPLITQFVLFQIDFGKSFPCALPPKRFPNVVSRNHFGNRHFHFQFFELLGD